MFIIWLFLAGHSKITLLHVKDKVNIKLSIWLSKHHTIV
jgi:hypothetical protein